MKFIELKDASFWSNKNKIMKDIGELMVITATPYEEIKSKLIEEDK